MQSTAKMLVTVFFIRFELTSTEIIYKYTYTLQFAFIVSKKKFLAWECKDLRLISIFSGFEAKTIDRKKMKSELILRLC
jgi:hypothetical protein